MNKKVYGLLFFLILLLFLVPFFMIMEKSWSLDSWSRIIGDKKIVESFFDTALVVFMTIIINNLIGIPMAKFLGERKSIIVRIMVYLPLVVPIMILGLGLQFVFIKINLTGNIIGVALVNCMVTLPYYILILEESFKKLDKGYWNLGKIYCKNIMETFFYIIVPIIISSIIVANSMVVIITISQYILNFMIASGDINMLSLVAYPYMLDGGTKNGAVVTMIYMGYITLWLLILRIVLKKGVEKLVRDDKGRNKK